MWKHLKDNRGSYPIWPAIILACIVVAIVFIGLLLIYFDSPIISQLGGYIG